MHFLESYTAVSWECLVRGKVKISMALQSKTIQIYLHYHRIFQNLALIMQEQKSDLYLNSPTLSLFRHTNDRATDSQVCMLSLESLLPCKLKTVHFGVHSTSGRLIRIQWCQTVANCFGLTCTCTIEQFSYFSGIAL